MLAFSAAVGSAAAAETACAPGAPGANVAPANSRNVRRVAWSMALLTAGREPLDELDPQRRSGRLRIGRSATRLVDLAGHLHLGPDKRGKLALYSLKLVGTAGRP